MEEKVFKVFSMEQRTLALKDGHELFYRVWNISSPIATVHINHGMAEHSLRYSRFATYLNKLGFSVYAQDHRGHGYTMKEGEKGWFADYDGWKLVVDDSFLLDKLIEEENPDVPHIVFGHSMGSFITRIVIAEHSASFAAAVLSGSGASMGIVGKAGKLIASLHAKRRGAKAIDKSFERLAFGSYVRHFPGEGAYAWLSRDKKEVRLYEEDPLSGFTCTSSFYRDLLCLIEKANDKKSVGNVRKDLPLLIVSGSMDPVGNYGKGIKKIEELYKSVGMKDVRCVLFPEDRHEILNEIDRDEVEKTIGAFMLETVDSYEEKSDNTAH